MSFFNDIRQAIVTKLQTLNNLQEVHFAQVSKFSGSPVAVVSVVQSESTWNSNRADKATFMFQILLYIPAGSTDSDMLEADVNMGEAFSEVILAFTDRQVLGSVCDWVEPIPSVWGFEERTSGVYRFAEINLRCVKHLGNNG